jgi:hypothetical protein
MPGSWSKAAAAGQALLHLQLIALPVDRLVLQRQADHETQSGQRDHDDRDHYHQHDEASTPAPAPAMRKADAPRGPAAGAIGPATEGAGRRCRGRLPANGL